MRTDVQRDSSYADDEDSRVSGQKRPETLAQVLGKLPKLTDERLLVGLETSDDAAIYKIR